MKKYTKELKMEMVERLRLQDKLLEEIFAERESIAKEARANGFFNELWEMLMSDGESHWGM